MLTFTMRKTKTMAMPVLVEGINQDQLRFKLVIEVNGVDYGFKSEKGGENVKFIIPPLDSVIPNLKEGTYGAKLEVSAITEGDRGFFMQPWGEQIQVKNSVSVAVAPVVEEEVETEPPVEKVKLKITSIFTESDGEPEEMVEIEEECAEKKASKNKKLRDKFK